MAEFNPGGAASLDEAVKLRYEANPDTNAFTDAEQTKLAGVSAGATQNASDAALRDRATHTGTQAIATVTGLQAALDGKAPLASPTFTGVRQAPTADVDDPLQFDNRLATTAFVGDVYDQLDALKANALHGHLVADVTGLQAALDAKAALAVAQSFAAAQGTAVVALTDGATIATDAALSNQFKVTLGGNRTMGAPTNLVEGRVYEWEIKQDGTGSRTLTWNAIFRFPGGAAPVLQTAAGASDIVTARFNGTNLHCIHSGGWTA